jgi:hypothetical protein
MSIPRKVREEAAPGPSNWSFIEKLHPGARAAWRRGPNRNDVALGITGEKNRFAVAHSVPLVRNEAGEWRCREAWYRDKLGDGEWHPRSDSDPMTVRQRERDQRAGRRLP